MQGLWRAPAGTPAANYDISDDGTLIHLSLEGTLGNVIGSVSDLVWVDRAGVEDPIGMEPCVGCLDFSVSPDGTRAAFAISVPGAAGGVNVWIWSFASNTLSRLTFEAGIQVFPTWSPDSRRIVFRRLDGLYVRPADGTGADQQLLQNTANMAPYELSTQDELLYTQGTGGADGNEDIFVLDIASGSEPRALIATAFTEGRPALSPDERWLAYESDETGQREIYVRPYPDVDSGKWQVSTSGGMQPIWSPDGSRLYFLAESGLMEAAVTSEPSFSRQTPVPLFDLDGYQLAAGTLRSYDISADGERFLMMREGRAQQGASGGSWKIIVAQNWVEELQRLVPKL